MNENFSLENFDKIKEFIYRKTGVSIEFNNSFEKLKTHIENFKDYFFKLRFDDEDGSEFQKLINKITNNDTYFYREKEQFDLLVQDLLPELDRILPKSKSIRILSAPCSSGEEVYSILIYLLEHSNLLEHRDIEIIGVDIDSQIIQKAEEAVYSEKSVQNLPLEILEKYFIKDKSDYVFDETLKKYAQFKIVNVFDKEQLLELGMFDIILSRNMFIYFDEVSRKAVANNFYEILNENGSVMLGNAEQMSRITSIYRSSKLNDIFIHQK